MSMTRRDWSMVSGVLKSTRPTYSPPLMVQWNADVWALAHAFKAEADRQGQKFDAARFAADCGMQTHASFEPPQEQKPRRRLSLF